MTISQAVKLRETGRCEEAIELLKALLAQSPNDGFIYYQLAWCNDVLEKEADAIPYYIKAIEYGLQEEDLKSAYLGLGSTYRVLGQYLEAKATYDQAIYLFPHNNEFKVFNAMVLYNLNEHEEAMRTLLGVIIETTSDTNILKYNKAIEYYSDKLNQVW